MNRFNSINDYIQKEYSGLNTFNQQEKNQYLGVLAERIYVLVTLQHVENTLYQTTIEKIIANNPGGKIKISAALEMKSRLTYIKMAQKHNTPFTLVDSNTNSDDKLQVAVIYHFEQPTQQNIIDVHILTDSL